MTKTEACWDRTEGCCMTDAFERKTRPKAPARIVFGGDDDREMWTWECGMRDHVPNARTFDDVPTFRDAVVALIAHQWWHHPVEAHEWLASKRWAARERTAP
jgi:hypothetical protein